MLKNQHMSMIANTVFSSVQTHQNRVNPILIKSICIFIQARIHSL